MVEPGRALGSGDAGAGAAALPFVIRPMQVRDIPAVMAIERRSFPSPWPESAYRYELRYGRNSCFYVLQPRVGARRDGLSGGPLPAVLGYVGLRLRGREAHIITIAIHPDWRGRGLGEFLLLQALEEALRRGARKVTLEVRPSNRVARRLYAKVGFTLVGIRRAYYRDGEDGWLMALGPLDRACLARLRGLERAVEDRLVRDSAP